MVTEQASVGSALAKAGRRIFGQRIWVGLIFAGLAGVLVRSRDGFVQENAALFTSSLLLVGAGLALRMWGAGSAGRHTRLQTIEAPVLATGGPYAWVRHPIYLGTMLLGLGMVGLLGELELVAFYLAACLVLYATMIPAEEAHLHKTFGAAYREYCARVPSVIPSIGGGARRKPGGAFSWPAASGEWRIALVLGLIYAGFRALPQ